MLRIAQRALKSGRERERVVMKPTVGEGGGGKRKRKKSRTKKKGGRGWEDIEEHYDQAAMFAKTTDRNIILAITAEGPFKISFFPERRSTRR